jgi:hypothetical protein
MSDECKKEKLLIHRSSFIVHHSRRSPLMPLTMPQFTDILKHLEVPYWVSPDRPALMFGAKSKSGKRYMISASFDGDGSFFQLRSVEYATCVVTHRNFPSVARLLLDLNYQFRGVKFSLDPRDGEIACFSDLLLFDADATQTQITGTVSFFLDIIDGSFRRIMVTIETGNDPGEEEPEEPAPEEPEADTDVV